MLGLPQKVPRQGEEKQVRTRVLDRHPERRSANEQPASAHPAHQVVQKPEYQKVEGHARIHEHDPEGSHYVEAGKPGEHTGREEPSEEQPQPRCAEWPGLTQREQEGPEGKPRENAEVEGGKGQHHQQRRGDR